MTNDEAKAIGLRAVAWDGWREMPGMLLRHVSDDAFRMRWLDAHADGREVVDVGPAPWSTWTVSNDGKPTGASLTRANLWPDFRDPATRGCLLALVREVWSAKVGPIGFTLTASGGIGAVIELRPDGQSEIFCGNTESEALVAALEAA